MTSLFRYLFLLCISLPFFSNGQNSALYATFFQNSHLQLQQINPSYFLEQPLSGSTQYQSYPTPLSRLKYYQGDFSMILSENQFVGIQYWIENEGKFIQRNRVYGLYGIKTDLSDKVFIAMGIKAGVINHRFKASTSSPESASNALDLGLGVSLRSERLDVGLALFQIPEAILSPQNEQIQLPKLLEGFISYKANVTENLLFVPFARVRSVFDVSTNVCQLSTNFLLTKQNIGGGMNLILNQGISPHLDIALPIDENLNVKIGASYFAATFTNTSTELSLIHI